MGHRKRVPVLVLRVKGIPVVVRLGNQLACEHVAIPSMCMYIHVHTLLVGGERRLLLLADELQCVLLVLRGPRHIVPDMSCR